MSSTPSAERPLTGGCACGAVRFAISAPLLGASYCHCTRCQRRTGTGSSLNTTADAKAFAITQGRERIRSWAPEGGAVKWFCGDCGGALFSTPRLDGGPTVGVRFGALDGDPGIRPQYHQFVDSAAPWDVLPDDGLPRYGGSRPAH